MDFYPSWRYHRTEQPRLVNDPSEEEALGEGWAETPAAFEEHEPVAESPAEPQRMSREELDAAEAAEHAEYESDKAKRKRRKKAE